MASQSTSYAHNLELVKKGWLVDKFWSNTGDDRVSKGCLTNSSQGWIQLEQPFTSGHLHPPRFPGCRCAVNFKLLGKDPNFKKEETNQKILEDDANNDNDKQYSNMFNIESSETLKNAISGKYSWDNIDEIGRDECLRDLFNETRFNAFPKLVDSETFSKLKESDEYLQLWRGIASDTPGSASRYVEEFKTGPIYPGTGYHGNGTYTVYGPGGEGEARTYTFGDGDLITMLISKKSKIITHEELSKLQIEEYDLINEQIIQAKEINDITTIFKLEAIKKIIEDIGRFGVIKGFDAIDVTSKRYCILLNRGIAILV